MKIRIFSFTISLVFALNSQAGNFAVSSPPRSSAKSKAEYCNARKSVRYFVDLAHNSENLMAFENDGGMFNGGVCWWHSLFQRSSLYLTVYRPDLPKPDLATAKKLIHSIAAGKKVIEIPGYANFRDFSRDFEKQIQSKLEAWQKEDGILKWAWIQGLSGSSSENPATIEKHVSFVVKRTETEGALEYTMWQFPGMTAHASINVGGWHQGGTYGVNHIDSNFPQEVREYTWAAPARNVKLAPYDDNFVPYVYRRSDLGDFKKAADAYCSSRAYEHDFFSEPLKNTLE